MKQIYIFSGLGVDERVFKYLDFTGFKVDYVQWIKHYVNESIESYAERLVSQVNTEKPILIGLSFGGIVAMEVAKFIVTEKIILIASAKCFKEIPYYYRWAGFLKLHKLLPAKFLKHYSIFTKWAFGVESDTDKNMLRAILKDLDISFLQWALDKIIYWKSSAIHSNTIHIHGENDRILPIRFINPDLIVKKGGHFMTVNKAKEITELLHRYLR